MILAAILSLILSTSIMACILIVRKALIIAKETYHRDISIGMYITVYLILFVLFTLMSPAIFYVLLSQRRIDIFTEHLGKGLLGE